VFDYNVGSGWINLGNTWDNANPIAINRIWIFLDNLVILGFPARSKSWTLRTPAGYFDFIREFSARSKYRHHPRDRA